MRSSVFRADVRARHHRFCQGDSVAVVMAEADALEVHASDDDMGQAPSPPHLSRQGTPYPPPFVRCGPAGRSPSPPPLRRRVSPESSGGPGGHDHPERSSRPSRPEQSRSPGRRSRDRAERPCQPPPWRSPDRRIPWSRAQGRRPRFSRAAEASPSRPQPTQAEGGMQTEPPMSPEVPVQPWNGQRRVLPAGSRVSLPDGTSLRLETAGALHPDDTTREAATHMLEPLCEHARDEWRLERTVHGANEVGHWLMRTRVVHTYEVPERLLQTYQGQQYGKHFVDPSASAQPSLGGMLPPGTPPPPRYPDGVPREFWEQLFRQTEFQRRPPPTN
ncbi:formin-like protein 5 [Patiria miniata]|uniref:Uncharacterized protein n=1 Tax=Patiria miniata TaxID=46514 RepID=A0A913ZX26_PATMI|nr:formin-like protein 5 [Patiria miniata]